MKGFDTAYLFITRSRQRRVARWGLVTLLLVSAPAFGQTTVWTDGTGDWFTPGNWSAGVPTSSTNAQISNGGTAGILSNGAAAGFVELGVGAGETGTLTVSGAISSLQDEGAIYIGEDGTGTLFITAGATVSSGEFLMGANAGSHATATVSGSGSLWTNTGGVCSVGFNATLNITNGGQLSNSNSTSIGSDGTAAVIVDGVGSTWSEFFQINIGSGTLTISNGGHVSNFGSTLGGASGSSGVVNVSGAGSTWTNGSFLELSGTGGDATLEILSGGAVSNGTCFMGKFSGTGTSTVDGTGSTWTINGDLSVGNVFGGVGTVTVSDGGQVTSTNAFIADGSSSIGTVQVDGATSTWGNSGNVYVGGDTNGAVGVGELNLTNGGTATAAAVTVWSSGMVTGNGVIEATGVTNHGILAPDQGISISGDLTFESTATMLSSVTPDTADSVMVQGTAALDGLLNVTLTGGPFIVGMQYTLLVANGGINGTTFSNVLITAPPGVNAHVTYDPNQVNLVIDSSGTPTPTPSGTASPTPTATATSTPTATGSATATATPTGTVIASPTPRLTPTPRSSPTARARPTPQPRLTPVPPPPSPRPTAWPRPTLPPHLTPVPSPTSPRPTPAPRP